MTYNTDRNDFEIINCSNKNKKKNRKNKYTKYDFEYDSSDYDFFNNYEKNYKKNIVQLLFTPRNKKQEEYVEAINNNSIEIIIATGSAGVGKTALIADIAMNKLLNNIITKIVLVRPSVSVDDNIGYLKGDMLDKMKPWMANIYDIFYKYITPNVLIKLLENETIEVAPLCFCRGRTFDNCIVILDEAQNTTPNQMLMLLTRLGNNCKIVITGDTTQHDRGFEKSGLSDLLYRLKDKDINNIKIIEFNENHIERNPLIKKILDIYK